LFELNTKCRIRKRTKKFVQRLSSCGGC